MPWKLAALPSVPADGAAPEEMRRHGDPEYLALGTSTSLFGPPGSWERAEANAKEVVRSLRSEGAPPDTAEALQKCLTSGLHNGSLVSPAAINEHEGDMFGEHELEAWCQLSLAAGGHGDGGDLYWGALDQMSTGCDQPPGSRARSRPRLIAAMMRHGDKFVALWVPKTSSGSVDQDFRAGASRPKMERGSLVPLLWLRPPPPAAPPLTPWATRPGRRGRHAPPRGCCLAPPGRSSLAAAS